MERHVRLSLGWSLAWSVDCSIGWSVSHNFLNGQGSFTSMLQSEHMLSDKRHCFHKILLLEPKIRIFDLDLELGFGIWDGTGSPGKVCLVFLVKWKF